jgi:hypothetical protein
VPHGLPSIRVCPSDKFTSFLVIFGHLLSQAKYFDVMEFDNVDIFRIGFEFLNMFFHELYRVFAALLPPQL